MEKSDGSSVLDKQLKTLPDLTKPVRIKFKDGTIMIRSPDGVYRREGSKRKRRR